MTREDKNRFWPLDQTSQFKKQYVYMLQSYINRYTYINIDTRNILSQASSRVMLTQAPLRKGCDGNGTFQELGNFNKITAVTWA